MYEPLKYSDKQQRQQTVDSVYSRCCEPKLDRSRNMNKSLDYLASYSVSNLKRGQDFAQCLASYRTPYFPNQVPHSYLKPTTHHYHHQSWHPPNHNYTYTSSHIKSNHCPFQRCLPRVDYSAELLRVPELHPDGEMGTPLYGKSRVELELGSDEQELMQIRRTESSTRTTSSSSSSTSSSQSGLNTSPFQMEKHLSLFKIPPLQSPLGNSLKLHAIWKCSIWASMFTGSCGKRRRASTRSEKERSRLQLKSTQKSASNTWRHPCNALSSSSFYPKLLMHLLLLISSLITTNAMHINDQRNLLKRESPSRTVNMDTVARHRRSSGSLYEQMPRSGGNQGGGIGGRPSGGTDSDCSMGYCSDWIHNSYAFNREVLERCVIFNNGLICLQNVDASCYKDLNYHVSNRYLQNQFDDLNCKEVIKNHTNELPMISQPTQRRDPSNFCYMEDPGVSLQSQPVFCSLFGDPHIVTYGGRKQTCAAIGAWPLVDNVYFTIQALNVPIGDINDRFGRPGSDQDPNPTEWSRSYSSGSRISRSTEVTQSFDSHIRNARDTIGSHERKDDQSNALSSASAINRVLVVFRSKLNCVAKEKIYDTTESMLPSSFNDGTYEGGHSDNLYVLQKEANGTHVELQAKYINTTIVIRRIGSYLSISVKSPVDVAKALPSYGHTSRDFHMELCSAACPDTETLAEFPATPPPPHPSKARVSYETARKRCSHLAGFFLDSCIFDVMTTGDWKTFVEIGQKSSEDESRLNIRSAVGVESLFPSPSNSRKLSSALSICTANAFKTGLSVFLIFIFYFNFSSLML